MRVYKKLVGNAALPQFSPQSSLTNIVLFVGCSTNRASRSAREPSALAFDDDRSVVHQDGKAILYPLEELDRWERRAHQWDRVRLDGPYALDTDRNGEAASLVARKISVLSIREIAHPRCIIIGVIDVKARRRISQNFCLQSKAFSYGPVPLKSYHRHIGT